jgi:hypothetical protein
MPDAADSKFINFAESDFTSEEDFFNALFHDEPQDLTATFLSVLTAPYAPPPPPKSLGLDPDYDARKSFDMVDWSPSTPDSHNDDSSDDEANAPPPPNFRRMTEIEIEEATTVPTVDDFERLVYAPHEKWAWTDGLAIEEPEILSSSAVSDILVDFCVVFNLMCSAQRA